MSSTLPPPLDQASRPISPELALVDRELAVLVRVEYEDGLECVQVPGNEDEPVASWIPAAFLESDARDAMLRMCELSDVNPPRARRGLALAVAVPTVLWTEALLLVASVVPLGAL